MRDKVLCSGWIDPSAITEEKNSFFYGLVCITVAIQLWYFHTTGTALMLGRCKDEYS